MKPFSSSPSPASAKSRRATDLASLIADAVAPTRPEGHAFRDGDVVVVTQKIVSKAEGRLVAIADDADAKARARRRRSRLGSCAGAASLVISETRHGFICANAGVDLSNVAEGTAALLPDDPDRSARKIRAGLRHALGVDVAVIVSDTFGRPWRRGVTDVAIGCAGVAAVLDLKGTPDAGGRELLATEICVADELASAAELVMGKDRGGARRDRAGRAAGLAPSLVSEDGDHQAPRRGPLSLIGSADPLADELEHRPRPVGQLGPRPPSQLDAGALDVETRATQLARTGRRLDARRFTAPTRGHRGQELVDGRLPAGGDVADEPTPTGRGPHKRIDDIVDEHEVPGLCPIPENRHRLVAHDVFGEDRHDTRFTVRNLARSVDAAQRQRTELECVNLSIRGQIVDDAFFETPKGEIGNCGCASRTGRSSGDGCP